MYNDDELFQKLVGKVVHGLSVSDGQHYLVIHTNGGFVVYETEADCCSETWFADITGIQCLVGREVREAKFVELPYYNTDDGRGRQESDQAYGFEIGTDRGKCVVVFRNSSNGYYGGWMTTHAKIPADTKFFLLVSANEWSA